MKTIQVEVKNVYGTERIYPLCDNAKRFARLTNTKTFNREIYYFHNKANWNTS
jgi:hypothetical protein